MPFGLSERDANLAYDQQAYGLRPVVPPVSGSEVALENTLAPFKGVAYAGAATLGALETGATSVVSAVTSPLTENLLRAGQAGAGVPEFTAVPIDQEDARRSEAIANAQMVNQFRPDPRTSGAGAQIIHGLVSGGVRMIGGAMLAGPAGGAALIGSTEGVTTRNDLIAHGVDEKTADELGVGSALFAGAGAVLPGGYGTNLLTRVTTGALAQTTLGATNRLMMHNVLDAAGYTDMAQQYKPLDGAALMADAVLGSAFGAVHHVFAPAITDSAHTIMDARSLEDGPGVPIDPVSRDANLENKVAAADALITGKDMPPLRDVETVPNPAQDAVREASARGAQDAADEAGAPRVDLPEPSEKDTADLLKSLQDEIRAQREQETPGSPLGRAARMAESAKAEGETVSSLDDSTQEALAQAQDVLTRRPDAKIQDEDGAPIGAREAIDKALEDVKSAKSEGALYKIAAACFGRA